MTSELSNQFFVIFFATVLTTRFFIYFFPISSPTIGKFRLHHYMYGIAVALLGITFNSIVIYAIGLGLFVDELTYLLMRGKTHTDNYSVKSILGTALLCLGVYLLKDQLILAATW